MSSNAKAAAISEIDMETIKSVLFRAGYDAYVLTGDERRFSDAALLLMQMVRSGENSSSALAEHLEDHFGRPAKYRVLFAPILPQYAMQGLPNLLLAAFPPANRRLHFNQRDLQVWENEGGTPKPASRH